MTGAAGPLCALSQFKTCPLNGNSPFFPSNKNCLTKFSHKLVYFVHKILIYILKKKKLVQEVCQKRDRCATSKGSSYTKNEYNLAFLLSQIRCWILFYSIIFLKKSNIFEKTGKNCFGGTFDNTFRERKRLTPKINITFFLSKIRYWIFYYSENCS